MKKTILFILLFLNSYFTFSQGYSSYWMMGYGIAPPPFGTTNIIWQNGIGSIFFQEKILDFENTISLISDGNNNLLFYSNGVTIINALNDTMQNGDNLNPPVNPGWLIHGMPIAQGNLVIPFSDDSSKYYLFHETAEILAPFNTYQPRQLYYSTIDMTMDSGKGAVTSKNNVLINDTLITGELTAVKHANGRDWWLIVHKAFSYLFYKYLITPAGIMLPPDTQTIANMYYAGGTGQSVFSPDGNWYARYIGYDDLIIMQFDRCTGTFYNPTFIVINDSATACGVAFSGNSKLLYVSSRNYLYQFNVDTQSISNTQLTIATYDNFYDSFPALQTAFYLASIAPDNKIYINSPNSVRYLHVINNPDSSGLACDIVQHGITLPTFNAFTMVNFPNYFLGPVLGSMCDSLGLGITENVYNKNLDLRVNPNPAQNSFYLNYELPTGKDATLYVYNTLGKLVANQKLYSVNKYLMLHCDTWQQGMYYLKVVMDKNEFAAHAKVCVIK